MRDQIKAVQDAIDNALKAGGQELTPRQLKAIQIAKAVTSFAQLMAKNCLKLSVQKKIFSKIDRRPIKRILRNQLKAQMAMAVFQTRLEVAKILSQPIHKFADGGSSNENQITGVSIIDETGKKEIIFVKNSNYNKQ